MNTDVADIVERTPLQARTRALTKTFLYRALMLVITVLVALVVTGSVDEALGIGIAANALKTGTYYAYERLWDHVAWGLT